jgi:hypothetical protein
MVSVFFFGPDLVNQEAIVAAHRRDSFADTSVSLLDTFVLDRRALRSEVYARSWSRNRNVQSLSLAPEELSRAG